MEKIFIEVFNLSISAVYLILAVILTRALLRKAPKNMICILWLLVGIRLIMPFSVESVFSLIPSSEVVDKQILYEGQYSAATGISAVDQPVNRYLQEHYDAEAAMSVNQAQILLFLCSSIWITGMVLMLGYFCISYYRIAKKVRMAVPQMAEGVKIYRCGEISSPFLLGMIRPRIYIPEEIPNEELPFVIQHERAHMQRKDYLLKPAFYLILTIYWFQPLVWAAYLLFCRDIELACDERVVKKLGFAYRKEYSQALLNCSVSRRHIIACPLAFGEVGVKQRIRNILHYKKPSFWVIIAVIAAAAVISVCFMTQKKPSVQADEETELFSAPSAELSETQDIEKEKIIEYLKQFPDSYEELIKSDAVILTEDYMYLQQVSEQENQEDEVFVPVQIGSYTGWVNREYLDNEALIRIRGSKVEKGRERWDTFYENVQQGIPAEMMMIQFTAEGTPIITYLNYNGKEFYVLQDSSREKSDNKEEPYIERKYAYLKIFEKEYENGEKALEIYLVNQEELTEEDIINYYLRSTYSEVIDFWMIACIRE